MLLLHQSIEILANLLTQGQKLFVLPFRTQDLFNGAKFNFMKFLEVARSLGFVFLFESTGLRLDFKL